MDLLRSLAPATVRMALEVEPLPLGALAMMYTPVIGRDRRAVGARLQVRARYEAPLAAVLGGALSGFDDSDGAPFPRSLVVLAPQNTQLDASIGAWHAPRNVLLELGPGVLDDSDQLRLLLGLQRNGVRTVLRTGDLAQVPQDRLSLFTYIVAPGAVLQPTRGRGAPAAVWVCDARDGAAVEQALLRGAAGVLGWPLHDPAADAPRALQPTQLAVLDLIRLVQSDADIADLERAFKGEPVLGYMLLTLVNSPAFAGSRPATSLGQAIMTLGYKRLARWLVLLLVIASKDSRALPLVHLAVVRGFLLEALATSVGTPLATRDDLFITGAFSLLDRITGQGFAQLFESVGIAGDIVDAVSHSCGPYAPWLQLARALEGSDADHVHAASQALALGQADVNTALMSALATADALHGSM